MDEKHVVDHLLAYVNGNLDEALSHVVRDHLALCSECRKEYASLNAMWRDLGNAAERRPSASLETGFREMLGAYEQGMRDQTGAAPSGRKSMLHRFGVGRPAFQIGLSLGMIALGVIFGYSLNGSAQNNQELSELRAEVRGLSNLLTVSLLHQESASERLKGVSWGQKLSGQDPGITAALIYTMNHDQNVNVRLASLDALSRELNRSAVRREILGAFPRQSSPLMQIALVDVLVQMNTREARDVLSQAMKKTGLNPDVEKRIRQAMQLSL